MTSALLGPPLLAGLSTVLTVVFVLPSLPPLCLVVFLGDCVDYVAGVEQLGLRTLLFLTLLQVQPAHRRCVGKGKERHLWRLPFFTSALYICFSFSFSVCRFKLKFSGAFSIGGSCEFGKETVSSKTEDNAVSRRSLNTAQSRRHFSS